MFRQGGRRIRVDARRIGADGARLHRCNGSTRSIMTGGHCPRRSTMAASRRMSPFRCSNLGHNLKKPRKCHLNSQRTYMVKFVAVYCCIYMVKMHVTTHMNIISYTQKAAPANKSSTGWTCPKAGTPSPLPRRALVLCPGNRKRRPACQKPNLRGALRHEPVYTSFPNSVLCCRAAGKHSLDLDICFKCPQCVA